MNKLVIKVALAIYVLQGFSYFSKNLSCRILVKRFCPYCPIQSDAFVFYTVRLDHKGYQSFRTHGSFVPRFRHFVPTFDQFVPNPLDDSYPTNYDTKCLKKQTLTSFILVIAKRSRCTHMVFLLLIKTAYHGLTKELFKSSHGSS